MGILLTLIGIASSLAMADIADQLSENQATGKGLSPDEIRGVVDQILNRARSEGTEALNKAVRKLNAINHPVIQSSSLRTYLQRARRAQQDKVDRISSLVSNVESELGSQQERANNLAYQSASYRNTHGQKIVDSIKDDTAKIYNDFNTGLKGVEQDV